MAKKDKQIDAAIKLYLEQYLNKTRVDRIIDKLAPEIKLYKHLGKAIQELKEPFERNWSEKGLGWKIFSIDFMIKKAKEEVDELDEAMTDAWGDFYLHQSLIRRLEQVLLEWKDLALVALMGIDRTMIELESLRKRLKEEKTPIREVLRSDGKNEIMEEIVDDIYKTRVSESRESIENGKKQKAKTTHSGST
ncbi:MAG: hypothetical protein ACTSPB_09955 [Candidatus Thorarchaeota archaeon]